MGAYLSEPITKKEITEEEDDNFWVSSASMQGWRTNQEDAHNAILNYDDYSSLFAVYDGHGGHEVAIYTAKKLPNYIKSRKDYRMGNIEDGLINAFLEFDKTLTEREIVRELRVIAGKEADTGEEVDHEEVDNLYQEATMPIEAVMAQNVTGENQNNDKAESSESDNIASKAGPTAEASALTRFKTRAANGSNKPISPFLRAKQTNNTSVAVGSDPVEENKNTENANGNDVATKLSFKEEETNADSKADAETNVINGSIENESQKKNGHSETKTVDDTKTNGHGKDEAYHSDSNGGTENAATPNDVKGKGKGKGKGKSSQIVKSKSASDLETDSDNKEQETVNENQSKTETEVTSKKAKSAKELYANLVNDEVMEEESEDDDNDQDAFVAAEDDDDDDDDEEIDSDATEEQESTDEEDTPDEDEEDEDEEEYIGGEFNEDPGNDSGCTAVVALLVGRELYVANAGDSRCVVCRDGKAIEMSYDHKPEDEPERQRINKAGGRVTQDGRVNGGLNLSRAIGDHAYKTNKELPLSEQMISPVPDVKKLTIDPEKDSFVLLACDGIWNSLSSQETVDFISTRLNKKNAKHDTTFLTNILKELFDHCLAPDTMGDGTGCDNMTAVIAKLKPNAFSAATAPAADKTAVTAAAAEESTKSDLTEKTKLETETAVNSEANSSVKRPAEDEPDKERIPEPQAKKVKTDSDNSDTTTTEEVKTTPSETEKTETKTEPETV